MAALANTPEAGSRKEMAMLTVERTLSSVAEGLVTIYGDEAQAIAQFALRQCQERHDAAGEKVWNLVLDQILTRERRPLPGARSKA